MGLRRVLEVQLGERRIDLADVAVGGLGEVLERDRVGAEEQQRLDDPRELGELGHQAHGPSASGALADRGDRDVAEGLVLRPRRLALLVELEQREQRHGDRHAIGAAHGLVEGRRAAQQQRAQMRQPLGDGDRRDGDVPEVEQRRHAQQPAERRAEAARVVDGAGLGELRAPQRRRQRRAAVAHAVLAGQARGQVVGGAAVAARLEHPRQQLLGGLAGLEIQQLLVVARQHEPRLELQQRGDQHEELRRDLEIELAARREVVEVGDDDLRELHLEQVDLLAQDERQQQVKRPGEDLEIELEGGSGHPAQASAGGRRRRPLTRAAGRRPSPRARRRASARRSRAPCRRRRRGSPRGPPRPRAAR